MRLQGKVAIITGAASGMGESTARVFAREGARLLLTDVLDKEGEAVAASIKADGGEAIFLRHDVTQEADWQKMIVVFADGQCHPGECYTGTFYVDFVGEDGHGAQHGEAFFELMRQVEANFRTKAPEILPE